MAVTVASTSTVATASGANLTLNQPSGVVSGDLLIAHIVNDRVTGSGAAISGWTQIHQTTTANDSGGGGEMVTFYKVSTGSDSFIVTFTDAGESRGFVARITGQTGSSPVGTSSEQVNDTAGTTATGSTVTPSNSDDLLLLCFAGFTTSGSPAFSSYAIATSDPAGWTEAWDSSGGGESLAMAYDNRTEVTGTGNATATISESAKSIVHVIPIAGDVSISIPVGTLTMSGPAVSADLTQTVTIPVGTLTASGPTVTVTQTDRTVTNKTKNTTTIVNKTKNNV